MPEQNLLNNHIIRLLNTEGTQRGIRVTDKVKEKTT
jgi:hypothetical protein